MGAAHRSVITRRFVATCKVQYRRIIKMAFVFLHFPRQKIPFSTLISSISWGILPFVPYFMGYLRVPRIPFCLFLGIWGIRRSVLGEFWAFHVRCLRTRGFFVWMPREFRTLVIKMKGPSKSILNYIFYKQNIKILLLNGLKSNF